MHGQVEFGIIPLYCLHQPLHDDPRFQFLPYFTLQGFLWRFPRFHLSSRKLPAILKVTIPTLGGEDTTIIIVYDCSYNFYLFHIASFSAAFSMPSSSSNFG